jgi:hypothetical protein
MLEKTSSGHQCDSDEDVEKLGDRCITNLKQLSKGSQQMYRYLDHIKAERNRKDYIHGMLVDRLSLNIPKFASAKAPSEMTSQVSNI